MLSRSPAKMSRGGADRSQRPSLCVGVTAGGGMGGCEAGGAGVGASSGKNVGQLISRRMQSIDASRLTLSAASEGGAPGGDGGDGDASAFGSAWPDSESALVGE